MYHLLIKTKHRNIKVDTKILLVTMTNSVGGVTTFDPCAELDDGSMSIYILKNSSIIKMIKNLPAFVLGHLDDVEEVEHLRTNVLEIEQYKNKGKIKTRIDGDESFSLPIKMEVINNAIDIIVPKVKN